MAESMTSGGELGVIGLGKVRQTPLWDGRPDCKLPTRPTTWSSCGPGQRAESRPNLGFALRGAGEADRLSASGISPRIAATADRTARHRFGAERRAEPAASVGLGEQTRDETI